MNTMHFPSNLQIFRENVDFVVSKMIACRVNSEIRVFVSKYPYKISVLFHTFFLTFGKVTDTESNCLDEYIKLTILKRKRIWISNYEQI